MTRRWPSWAASPLSPACPSAAAVAADAGRRSRPRRGGSGPRPRRPRPLPTAAAAPAAAAPAAAAPAAPAAEASQAALVQQALRLPTSAEDSRAHITISEKPEPFQQEARRRLDEWEKERYSGSSGALQKIPAVRKEEELQNIMRVMEGPGVGAAVSGGGARAAAAAPQTAPAASGERGHNHEVLPRLLQPGAASREGRLQLVQVPQLPDGVLLDLFAQGLRGGANARLVPARQGRPRADQTRHRRDDERRLARLGQGGGQRR